jgi:predicted MFS family arabinose efflux permease
MVAGRSLWRNREFMLLWSGQTLSTLGTQISLVAYPLLALAVTGSPAKAGVVGFAKTVPIAILALPAGELADRVNRKYLMVASDGVRAVALVTIPISLAVGGVPYWLIVAVAFIDGSGFVFSYIAERGALRQLVSADQLSEAVARNESRTFGAMLAGPPLGGLLFGIGRVVPFLCDAISYAASTISMLLIESDFQEARSDSSRREISEGFRWLWARPFFRVCSLLFAGSNPIFTGLYLLVVVLAKQHGASAPLVGVMLGIAAAGGLVGALLAPTLQRRLSPRLVLIGESWILALSIPWLLLAHDAPLLGLILAAAELITPVTNSIVVTFRVALTPDRLQGRVQAAATMVSFSFGWLGPLLVGFLLQSSGATATILILTGWALLLALGASGSRAFRSPPTIGRPPSTTPSPALEAMASSLGDLRRFDDGGFGPG